MRGLVVGGDVAYKLLRSRVRELRILLGKVESDIDEYGEGTNYSAAMDRLRRAQRILEDMGLPE